MQKILNFRLHILSLITGFQIGLNTCGLGLSLEHRGTIIINGHARVGENCRIQTGVTIGSTNGQNDAPVIGNRVFIGTGAKIIGGVQIADSVNVGANAVVVKDILQSGISVGGVPAKKISDNNSDSNTVNATEIVRERRNLPLH